MKFKVFVDDITGFLEGHNKELPSSMGKVLRAMRVEVEKKGLKLSNTEGGKQGESQVVALCSYLEDMLQECNKREGVGSAHCGDTRSGSDDEDTRRTA